MSNYYERAKSNWFKVRDPDEFDDWIGELPVKVITEQDSDYIMVLPEDEYGGFPDDYYDDEWGEYVPVDFYRELGTRLAPGEVAVFMTIGNESRRYLAGTAVAVNSAGEIISISLDDIYQRVHAQWGIRPTHA